jgi:hypothetical protein
MVGDQNEAAADANHAEQPRRMVAERAEAYAAGAELERQLLVDVLESMLSEEGHQPTIYAAKLTPQGYRNQVWQGRGNTAAHDLMVFVDQTENRDDVLAAMRTRLNPVRQSGFDAIVVATEVGDEWEPHEVVEYEHSAIGTSLRAHFPDLTITRVPDPASSPQVATQPTPPDETSEEPTTEEVLLHLQEAKNVVLQGPPGTGKTRLALAVASGLAGGLASGCRLETVLEQAAAETEAALKDAPVIWEIVQMHPASTYEDFVRGQRTDPAEEGLSLISVDGILPRICHVASLRSGKPTLLILDEVNRGNLSAVLGEAVLAIDPAHRGQPVTLQYDAPPGGSTALTVPENLFILATMNTADRTLATFDFAIRRRFRFLSISPSVTAIQTFYGGNVVRADRSVRLFSAIRQAVADPDLQLGHSYFMVDGQSDLDDDVWARRITDMVLYEVRPLLREYLEEGRPLTQPLLELDGTTLDLLGATDDEVRESLAGWLGGAVAHE